MISKPYISYIAPSLILDLPFVYYIFSSKTRFWTKWTIKFTVWYLNYISPILHLLRLRLFPLSITLSLHRQDFRQSGLHFLLKILGPSSVKINVISFGRGKKFKYMVVFMSYAMTFCQEIDNFNMYVVVHFLCSLFYLYKLCTIQP